MNHGDFSDDLVILTSSSSATRRWTFCVLKEIKFEIDAHGAQTMYQND